ncbi:winged helix-turn-helix domain-containing protein [Shewanella olleyana]|uniref:winged helix-turn-helix domain-containing protein n=1 Tax=Shewanella olleyana TaxID=135626 RepID=UPI00200F7345|nr:winged helix-turn-helix domain-containing protein [Shewanella olleyana]
MIYQCNDLQIDLVQYQIRRTGKLLSVEPKVFDLIIYLIQHRERLISREELLENIWHGRNVTDTTLSNHIKSARKLFGDNGEQQNVIKTIRTRGYQFIAVVTIVNSASNQPIIHKENIELQNNVTTKKTEHEFDSMTLSSPVIDSTGSTVTSYVNLKVMLIAFTCICLLAIFWKIAQPKPILTQPYLLILPISVSSRTPEKWEPFAEQITRELIQGLRKVPHISTVPPPTAFTFKNNKTRSFIKEQLPNTQFVLDGMIKEGINGQFQISVELENLTDSKLIWDGSFDIKLNNQNQFSIQNNIASSVSNSLQKVLTSKKINTLVSAPTSNMQAYKLYVQGQHQQSLMTGKATHKAIEFFNAAIQLDPNFTDAYIAKANAYRIAMVTFDIPRDVLPEVISSATEVITITPNASEAISSLGLAYVHAWQWPQAWKMLIAAQEKDPDLALTELGFTLYHSAMGNIEGLKKSLLRADELDPLNMEIADWGMWALLMNNQIDLAKSWGRKKSYLLPDFAYLFLSLSVAEYLSENYEQSLNMAQKGVSISNRSPYSLIILAQAYAASGKATRAKELIVEAEALVQYTCPYETAIVYALLNETDKVFSLLNEAVEYHSNCLIFTRQDPRLSQYKLDKRFQTLLQKIKLDDESIKKYHR